MDLDVPGEGFDLRRDDVCRQREGRGDTGGALRGDGGNGAGSVDAERRKRLEVRLNACAAA